MKSISRFQQDTPIPGDDKRRKSNGGRRPQGQEPAKKKGGQGQPGPETPLWEKLAGLVGLLLVVGVLGYLVYEGVRPRSEAAIVTAVESITPQAGGYLVTFTASNTGRQTAASVLVEGALYDAAGAEPVESAEMTFDYLPDQSDRSGALVFERDPRQYDLRLQVKGFMDP